MNTIARHDVEIGGPFPARLWLGGSGAPLLLLHGAWAGAEAHWSAVWDALAERHRIVAPEWPGIAPESGPAWTRYDDYLAWLQRVLAALDLAPAVVCGNSFGATLAWLLALRQPACCRALVMVDGFPPPALPAPLRWLLRRGPLRRGAIAHMRRHVFGPQALRTAFHDPARAPAEVRRRLEQPDAAFVESMLDIVLNSRRVAGRPAQPALLVWGRDDHLPNAGLEVGRRLQAGWPGAELAVVDDAGHLPQVEQPQRFVDALERFIDALPGS